MITKFESARHWILNGLFATDTGCRVECDRLGAADSLGNWGLGSGCRQHPKPRKPDNQIATWWFTGS